MDPHLSGTIAVVTGVSGGVGPAVTRALAGKGAGVVSGVGGGAPERAARV